MSVVHRRGGQARAGIAARGRRQAAIGVARVCRTDRYLMPAGRQTARNRIRQPGDASIRPRVTAIRRDVQDA